MLVPSIPYFRPLQWQIAPFRDTSPLMLLAGGTGGGKSRLAAEKVHAYMLKYPGATGLILRKTRESLRNTVILFMNKAIIGTDPRVNFLKGDGRWEYYNGSNLILGGMKDDSQREQIRGIGADAGVDIVWMEEATHFKQADLSEVAARMRGKAAYWNQIILSCNPAENLHWINQDLRLGKQAISGGR